MNTSPSELISAYFDGELVGEELAEAERILAGSSTARRWLKQLRKMRAVLQALPEDHLGEDFAERVLRQAESQTLEQNPTHEIGQVAAPVIQVAQGKSGDARRWSTRRRQLALGAAALAASLALVFFGLRAILPPNAPDVATPETPGLRPAVPSSKGSPSLASKPEFRWPEIAGTSPGETADIENPSSLAKPTPSLAKPTPGPKTNKGFNWALVCDSFSQASQLAAIEKFESLLREQNVAIDTAAPANQPANGDAPVRERIYVVDATKAQLSVAFAQLQKLTAERQVTVRVDSGDPIGPTQVAKGTGPAASGNSPSFGPSRAVQLPTGKESGPALTSLPRSGSATSVGQSLQRAVFVFRVVAPPSQPASSDSTDDK